MAEQILEASKFQNVDSDIICLLTEQFVQYKAHHTQFLRAIFHQVSAFHFLQKALLASIIQSQETQEVCN